ncbi:hypothetical protein BDA96_02G179600 [Sorghum bicolor]|uniref:Uncharacterized protein n=1 Tax=Sorghum bicolor TaxID=4558 RepID=A0A921RP44_SORBI|nr:hypothetical protein BDA96_02G179600 [Sorghum bicolor]
MKQKKWEEKRLKTWFEQYKKEVVTYLLVHKENKATLTGALKNCIEAQGKMKCRKKLPDLQVS